MTKFYSKVTTKGLELISDALANDTKLDLKYIAIGDSNGNYYEPDETQTSLVNEQYRAEISEVTALVCKAQIPNNIGGFYIREIGVLDSDGNLILVAKQPETYKPVISEGSTKELWIKVLIQALNSDAIEMKFDTSIQCATIEYVNNLMNLHKHKDLMPIAIYDTNYNGKVDTCEYIDGGTFTGDSTPEELEELDTNSDLYIGATQTTILPDSIMSTTKYDSNGNGIVDNAENIDAGEF